MVGFGYGFPTMGCLFFLPLPRYFTKNSLYEKTAGAGNFLLCGMSGDAGYRQAGPEEPQYGHFHDVADAGEPDACGTYCAVHSADLSGEKG